MPLPRDEDDVINYTFVVDSPYQALEAPFIISCGSPYNSHVYPTVRQTFVFLTRFRMYDMFATEDDVMNYTFLVDCP